MQTERQIVDVRPPQVNGDSSGITNRYESYVPDKPDTGDKVVPAIQDQGGGNMGTEVPGVYKVNNLDELIHELEERKKVFRPLSEDDLKRLRRRQAAQRMVAGISDFGRAIANMVATSQYAPDAYREGLSDKLQAKFDKEKAQREADAEKYFNYAMQIGRLKDAARRDGLQIWQLEQNLMRQDRAYADGKERADAAARRADAKERRDEMMFQAKYALQLGKLTYQGYQNAIAEIRAGKMEELTQAQIDRLNRSGSGGSGVKYYGTLNGVRYATKSDYEKALAKQAKEYGVATEEILESSSSDGLGLGNETTSRQVKRGAGAVAADTEAAAGKKTGQKYSHLAALGLNRKK